MLEHRPFARLGHFTNDWLHAHYHFSFADYVDPDRMGIGALRVWNDDTIRAGTGFPPHGHRDMEIITYIRQGAISHEDSLGNHGRTEAGQVQVMSAGTGIRHAEYNREDHPTTLFQVWITPRSQGLAPRWETRPFPRSHGSFDILASGLETDHGAPVIHQDARVLGGTFDKGLSVVHPLILPHAYLVVARGAIEVGGVALEARDGIVLSGETALTLTATQEAELVLVETV